MKKILLLVLTLFSLLATAQQITLKKGAIIDNIKPVDSISETFAVYLPTAFDIKKKWPIIFVYDHKGRGKRVVSVFRAAAEQQGYILAASNSINDSLSLSKNVLISSRMFNAVFSMLPIKKNRVYTGGFAEGARLASLMPTFIKQVKGVISCGSPVANIEVLNPKSPFHFIGIVGNEDFNYPEMLQMEKILNRLKFPNNLFIFQGGHEWPNSKYISRAMEMFTLASMANNVISKDDAYIEKSYKNNLGEISALVSDNKPLLADGLLNEIRTSYRLLRNTDTLKLSSKTIRKTSNYKIRKRAQNASFFNEALLKEDYIYYLEEDVLTYNYNNLGWWKYQMDKLDEYENKTNIFEKQLGRRLKAFVNALVADNIYITMADSPVDEEALNLLWMVNTITNNKAYDAYLKIISYSAKIEDYSTALFYLEELLKNGYTNEKELYSLKNTALLRIMPEFNKIIKMYLKDARYQGVDE